MILVRAFSVFGIRELTTPTEKRKTWVYDVPLPAVHHLREVLNGIPPEQPITDDALARYDAPVLASAVKLWALELDPPLGTWEERSPIRLQHCYCWLHCASIRKPGSRNEDGSSGHSARVLRQVG